MWLLKAKKYAVGTKRKRKTGWWIKDRPGHWRMLTSHIRDQHKKDDVHPNHAHAKLMQQAARKIVRQLGQNRSGYSRSIADSILDSEYKNADIKRFSAWKKRVLDGVEKYLKEMIPEKSSAFEASLESACTMCSDNATATDDRISPYSTPFFALYKGESREPASTSS